jgi:hypothetical protein
MMKIAVIAIKQERGTSTNDLHKNQRFANAHIALTSFGCMLSPGLYERAFQFFSPTHSCDHSEVHVRALDVCGPVSVCLEYDACRIHKRKGE